VYEKIYIIYIPVTNCSGIRFGAEALGNISSASVYNFHLHSSLSVIQYKYTIYTCTTWFGLYNLH